MVLIIQKDFEDLKFEKLIKKITLFQSLSNIQTYNIDYYTIFLINIEINEDGFIKNTNMSIEEILQNLKVLALITNQKSKVLRKICKNYNVFLLEVNY